MALTAASLVAYYSMEDTAGTDATGRGNTLTATNSPTAVAGKVANGGNFVAASQQYYTIADNADTSMGDIDFALACWLKPTTLPGAATLFGKWHSSGGVGTPKEYWIGTVGTALGFFVSNDGTAQTSINFGTALSTATWYFVVAWHNSVANTINICANDGTVASTAHTTGVFNGVSPFRIAGMASSNNYQNGVLDEVAVWKDIPTAADITDLYNAGNGRDYAYVSAMGTVAGQPMALRQSFMPKPFGRGF